MRRTYTRRASGFELDSLPPWAVVVEDAGPFLDEPPVGAELVLFALPWGADALDQVHPSRFRDALPGLLPQFHLEVRTADYGDPVDRTVVMSCWSRRAVSPPAPTHGPLAGNGWEGRPQDCRNLLRWGGSVARCDEPQWAALLDETSSFTTVPLVRGLGSFSLECATEAPPELCGEPGLPAVLVAGASYDEPGQWVGLAKLLDYFYAFVDERDRLVPEGDELTAREAWDLLREVPGRAFARTWTDWLHVC